MWTLAFGYHEDRMPTQGYEETREAAWRRSPRAGRENEISPYGGQALTGAAVPVASTGCGCPKIKCG
jgi:hypothetical protein